jgi:hypothetical protein
MERENLLNNLALTESDAQQVQLRIRDQKRMISSLHAKGDKLNGAEQQLLTLERVQDNLLAEMDRLRAALEHSPL